MSERNLFTSESVSEGHPDKVSDFISDSILDALLEQDPMSRVACEPLVTTGLALVAGEITTKAIVDYREVVREAIKFIGYDDASIGFDWETSGVLVSIGKQSPDIAQGVDESSEKEQGAGDQGMMFGYACTETEHLIQQALAVLMQGRTTFVIAQRLLTLKAADQIIVLDHGRIVQRGKHDELLAQEGLYRQIYDLQLRDQEEFLALQAEAENGASISNGKVAALQIAGGLQ